jgi:D-alanyl-D-alanine carboxypeptidase
LVVGVVSVQLNPVDVRLSRALSDTLSLAFDVPTRFAPLASGPRLVAQDGRAIVPAAFISRWPVRVQELPAVVRDAVLAAEDSGFYHNGGIDIAALERAGLADLRARRVVVGASTITEQLAKLNFTGRRRSVVRKVRDAIAAAELQHRYSKDAILERYLNQVYLGRGAYGLGAASRAYFDVAPQSLTIAEAATLAGLIRAPSAFDPIARPRELEARRNHVIALMHSHGWLSAADAQRASAEPLAISLDHSRDVSVFVDAVRHEASALPALGRTSQQRQTVLARSDLTIETTLDLDEFAAVKNATPTLIGGPGGPAAAVAVVSSEDGAVRAVYEDPHGRKGFPILSGPGGPDSAGMIESAFAARARAASDGLQAPSKAAAESLLRARALGPNPNLLQVAAASVAFDNTGRTLVPYTIRQILDARGRVLYRHAGDQPAGRAQAGAGYAEIAQRKADTAAHIAVATTPQTTDTWLVGSTSRLSVATWTGVPGCSVPAHPLTETNAFETRAAGFARDVLGVKSTSLDVAAHAKALNDNGPSSTHTVAQLQANLVTALARAGASKIAAAVDIDGHGRVFDANAYIPMPPASTNKLYTGAVALGVLGPNYRFRTEARSPTRPIKGVVRGELDLVAAGDPTFDVDALARLAQDVARAGVRRIDGDIVIDDTHYDNNHNAPSWETRDVPDQAGPLSAFAVQENRWRCDAAYRQDPARSNGQLFAQLLAQAGVHVQGSIRIGPATRATYTLAQHMSSPLTTIVTHMFQQSDTFTAELLLKEIGTRIGDPTTAGGAEVVRRRLHDAHITATVADGSGVSPLDHTTAADEVTWLARMQPQIEALLPIACVNGTLADRMCSKATRGRVHAKTGTLHATADLAGYTTTMSGKPVRFTILLDGVHNILDAKQAIDQAVTAIATSDL